jgi:subtilase family serine protease
MSLRARFVALTAVSALMLTGCGGGGHSPIPQTTNAPVTPYNGPQSLSNFTWGADLMKSAQYAGPASVQSLSVDVELDPQDAAGLLQYAQMASDPKSPVYRHFLTPQEIGDRYGASAANFAAAAAYFKSYHLGVGTWPQRLTMVVSGKQSDIEAAFGTKLGTYREFGRTFVAPTAQPHFSRAIPVAGVVGLVHLNLNKTFLIRPGNGNYFGMSAPQLRRAFDFSGAAKSGFDGTGIAVGIIGTGPISSADVPTLAKIDNVKAATVTMVPAMAQTPSPLNNNTGTSAYDDPTGLATPPPVTAPCNQLGTSVVSAGCNPEDGEAQVDSEQVALLAPGASVDFYLAYNTKDCSAVGAPSGCLGIEGLFLTDDEIQQAIADNAVDALSLSYGFPESSGVGIYYDASGAGIGPEEFAALRAEGIAVFVSSGDDGAHDCVDPSTGAPTPAFCPDYPSTDPSVVSVGGVNYPMDSYGNLPPSAQITAWANNTTLGGDGLLDNSPGSGGGISQVFHASQSYQSTLPSTIQGTPTNGMRTIPDVSMLGDPLTGAQFVMNAAFPADAGIGAVGGTSVSAPEMAAAWTVVLQACKANAACATSTGAHAWRLGDPKALFYSIYGNSTKYAGTFYDVLAGNNGDYSDPCAAFGPPCATPTPTFYSGYNAGTGYDMVTGVGVPFVGHLINAVVGGQNVP